MMQPWFRKASLIIFIHWGGYAVQKRGGESWHMARGSIPKDAADELATVVKIELDGPLDLYSGESVAIDTN